MEWNGLLRRNPDKTPILCIGHNPHRAIGTLTDRLVQIHRPTTTMLHSTRTAPSSKVVCASDPESAANFRLPFERARREIYGPSIGSGVRFRLSKQYPLSYRIDYALGSHSDSLYFSVGEAF